MVTPAGVVATANLPASGAGPDIRRLLCGSEGALGVLTQLVLRVQRVPQSRAAATFDFGQGAETTTESFLSAAAAARAVVQAGLLPSNLRAVDKREAMVMGLGRGDSAVLLLAFESQLSSSAVVDAQLAAAAKLVEDAGGVRRRGERAGKAGRGGGVGDDGGGARQWKSSFVVAPAGRDDILLRGLLVETLETAVCWSRFKALHAGVLNAIEGAASKLGLMVVATCRLTHVYTDGCAPYFTVVCSDTEQLEPTQMLSAWDAIKAEANTAISALGGTASHHHAVGRDHLSVYKREAGPLTLRALGAVKAAWDPNGVLNPGALGLVPVGRRSHL